MNKYEKHNIAEAVLGNIVAHYYARDNFFLGAAGRYRTAAIALINVLGMEKNYIKAEFSDFVGIEKVEKFYDKFADRISV